MIQADSTLLHRALENLVLNAMDAMPAGGVMMLRTTHDADGRPSRNLRYRFRIDQGRVRAPLHALLHHQAARHRLGPGHRAIGDQRSWRANRGRKRERRRNNFSHHSPHRAVKFPAAQTPPHWLPWKRILATHASQSPHPDHRRRCEYPRFAGSRFSAGGPRSQPSATMPLRALEIAKAQRFDLILSDVVMPRKRRHRLARGLQDGRNFCVRP